MEFRRHHHVHGGSVDDDFDRQKDRKQRRRTERQAQKRARIENHEKWVEQCRLTRIKAQEERGRKEAQKKALAPPIRPKSRSVSSISSGKRVTAAGGKAARSSVKDDIKGTCGRKTVVQREESQKRSMQTPPDLLAGSATAIEPAPVKYIPPTLRRNGSEEISANVAEVTRRIMNKLTVHNVAQMTKEASELFGGTVKGATRATVLRSISQHINNICMLDTGLLTAIGSVPFAGLIRGLQLLHGNVVGAELVEGLCMALQEHLQQCNETGVSNGAMILAHLYILNAVDAVLISSFLRSVLQTGSSGAVCAVAGGLTLLRVCGEKLLKEAPGQMEQALAEAKECSKMQKESSRYTALLSYIADIVAGRTRSAKRTANEEVVPIESLLREMATLLPGGSVNHSSSSSFGNRRVLLRIMSTTSVLMGVTWSRMVCAEKPPRWYLPGAWENEGCDDHNNDDNANNDEDNRGEGDTSEEESVGDSLSTHSESRSADDEAKLKAARIRRIRQEEKALSGQRLNTENKREVFQCIMNASDDLEAFTFLMHRDPSFSRLHDTLAVLLQSSYQEKVYNPYYTLIIWRLCSVKASYRNTLQFALWDVFKAIRVDPVDVTGYFNFSCLLAYLIEEGIFTLGVLRGLDLESTNRRIGLFTRILVLRLILQLPPEKLTEVFFGGDGFSAHDVRLDTSVLRANLAKVVERYFVDEQESRKWIPHFYDVVAVGTPFGADRKLRSADADKEESMNEEARLQLFERRIHVVFKALECGIS